MLKESVSFLVNYFVRRNLTDYPATRDLDNIFISLVDECEKNKTKLPINLIKDFLMTPEKYAEQAVFEEKLRGGIYETNADVARFLLCKTEETHFTKQSKGIDLWRKDDKNKKYEWTIEHIFPEGENIPKEWVKIIAGGDLQKAKKIQSEQVHRIGNLTLTGYNSNLSNFPFEKKKKRTDKKGNPIGYNSGLYLNKELIKKNSWTEQDIINRTEKLAKEILEILKPNF